ncbi:pilus assembly protein PilM [Acidihalobacter prosperus]
MSLLRPKKKPLLGIDISSTAVKLVELGRRGTQYRVEAFAVEPLPVNSVNEKNITDVDAVGESLRRVLKKAGTKNKHCALAVPTSAVISKTVTLPATLKESELEGQIEIEAEQYIPYSLEEINLDFEIMGKSASNPDLLEVLLVASRSENVDLRVGAANLAGLTPRIMDVESYATEHAVAQIQWTGATSTSNHTVAVVDIGATMTGIYVLENGIITYSREQSFGGKMLTEDIMSRYGLSYEEAGLAKKEGGLPDNYSTEVLEPFKDSIAQQTHRFLQFYYAATEHQAVDQILLAGGCASIPGIDELVESQLEIPTTIANPFSQMSITSGVNPQRLANDAPALMIACGLALRSFD